MHTWNEYMMYSIQSKTKKYPQMKKNILIRKLFLFVLLITWINIAIANSYSKPIDPLVKDKISSWTKNKSVFFVENKGQMADTDGNPVPCVLFKAEAPTINIWVTTTGLTYQFLKFEDDEKEKNTSSIEGNDYFNDENVKTTWHRVDMILKNANIKKENIITEGDITQGEINYYLGHCPNGIFNVKIYSKITIKNIYEGIDWVLYSNNSINGNSIKQDFIVRPNADPNQIKLIYEGSGKFDAKNNQIHFENEIGELHEGKLFCYQGNENNEISSNYIVKKNAKTQNFGAGNFLNEGQTTSNNQQPTFNLFSYEIDIETGNYNKNESLIIDPQLVWATFYGGGAGNGADGFTSIVNDATGNIFCSGYCTSSNFPLLNIGGAYYQGTLIGSMDLTIVKFSPSGTLLWSTYYGGNGQDLSADMCLDSQGNIFITGRTESVNFPFTLSGPSTSSYLQFILGGMSTTGTESACILKFNNNGVRLWATYYGGSGYDYGYSICRDLNDNIYVTGQTFSVDFPIFNPGSGAYFQPLLAGTSNAFILKFNNNGIRLWATYYGGSDNDFGYSICSDLNGNMFVVGTTNSSNFPIYNSGSGTFFQSTYGGTTGITTQGDVFILKFNATGILLWGTYYGGNDKDNCPIAGIDKNGNLFVVGTTKSTNFPLTNMGGSAYFQGVYNGGNSDLFVLKFNNNGIRLHSTYYGGNGDDHFSPYDIHKGGITFDECNNLYISLSSTSSNLSTKSFCTTGYIDSTTNTSPTMLVGDGFIIKLNNSFSIVWASYFGGVANDFISAMNIDKQGNLFMVGEWTLYTSSTASYPLINIGNMSYFDTTYNGSHDIFIAKFIASKINPIINNIQANCSCNGSSTLTATGGCSSYNYTWYNSSWGIIGNTQTINNLCPGTYQVVVKDSISCSKPDTSYVTITGTVSTIYVTQNPVICAGNSFMLPDSSFATTTGVYIDTVKSTNGCDSIITTNLTVNPNLTSTINQSICNGNSYLFNGINITAAGVYKDTLPSVGGCDSIVTLNLSVIQGINTSYNPAICFGSSYSLPDGSIVTTPGTYTDTIKSISGCDSIISTINLTVHPNPIINIIPNITITQGTSTTLVASGGANYNWQPPAGLSTTNGTTVIASPVATTTYCVETNDNNGCKDTACVTVTVVDSEPPCVVSSSALEIPNAFSPNGDNINEEFCLLGWDRCIESFTIFIFNRWGEKVFESNNTNFCWDGTFNSKPLDTQVFVYYISAKYINEHKKIKRKGNILMIR